MAELSERPAAARAIYRGMDRAALDAAYNNGAAVADSPQWLARWHERSAVVRSGPQARLDIPYGSRPRARFDYFSAGAARPPLLVFIHGGYWQRNDKDTFAFLAEGPRAHGIDVAVVGYTLAPDARLADIVGEIHQALTVLSTGLTISASIATSFSWAAGRQEGISRQWRRATRPFAAALPSAASSIWSPLRSPTLTRNSR